MGWILGGAASLLLLVLGLRAFASASVAQLRRALAWGGGLAALAAAVLLVVSGRGGQLGWALVLFGPMAWRWWQGRRVAARFGAAAGDAVRTATLEMRLDPAGGTWSGTVLRGPDEGRALELMSRAELEALLRDCESADAESVPLLAAWLDRAHPGWRDDRTPAGAPGPMTRAEALAVLGLAEGAGAEAVRAAYTRLMRAAHPDAGGSDWIAARLNEARDILLRD